MSLELWICVALAVLLVAQQVFWLANVQRLVNKLTSRNYLEYVQAEVIKSPHPVRKKEQEKTQEFIDDYSVQQTERANSMFGFGGGR